MKKILLIAPDFQAEYRAPDLGKLTFMAPLSLATVAALTPDDIEVDIWDEPVHGVIDESTPFDKDYDLVGLTGYVAHLARAKEIARMFRKRDVLTIIGGPGVSSRPEYCRDAFDVLFIGEAEFTWPEFIEDWKKGSYHDMYRQVVKPDLVDSPVPRWDSIKNVLKHYFVGAVQTTRGCPFDCEFCDVIYLFGRRPRHKPIPTVLEEVNTLQWLGMDSVFFSDDNFIGDPRYAKDLLRELIKLNHSFPRPLVFHTQLTINVERDDEMLELLADANFGANFIGIETPNIESLKEANKLQNTRADLIESCKKVMSYGLPIVSGMIVGFDHDDQNIFDQQFEFLQEACIPVPAINMLDALWGTKLWHRMYKEGRVIRHNADYYDQSSRNVTTLIPKQMSRKELMEGFCHLQRRIRDWSHFEARVKGMIDCIKRKPNVPNKPKDGAAPRLPPQAMRSFMASLEPDARRAIINIIGYVRLHAPFMMDKVMGLVIPQYGMANELPKLIEAVEKEIELEESGEVKLEIYQDDILIPESFQKPYKEIFPEIYQYVHQCLIDKKRTDDVLIEVFADFITRWGSSFTGLEEHYKHYLYEIADRAITKENKNSKPLISHEHAPEPDIRASKLADEILKAVQQELSLSNPGGFGGKLSIARPLSA